MKSNLNRATAILAGLVVLSLLLGCRKQDFSLVFSHEKHVVENEIECSTCHQPAAGGTISKPGHEVCSNCHEIDEAKPSPECLTCHKARSASEIKVGYPVRVEKKEIKFSHETHMSMQVKCKDCHRGVESSTSLKRLSLPPMEVCLGCHNDVIAPRKDCSLCHVESSPVNATHKADWETQHGIQSKFGNSQCMVCHQEDVCIKCHQDQKPRDHNNTWRRVTHGAEAAWNRSRCMVCHQEDFCERCHRHTEPMSHKGGWVNGPTRHCFQCHFPIGSAGCSVCHKDASHPSAPGSPHPPFRGFVCQDCHPTPAGIFPPHPDPGAPCTICHERR